MKNSPGTDGDKTAGQKNLTEEFGDVHEIFFVDKHANFTSAECISK